METMKRILYLLLIGALLLSGCGVGGSASGDPTQLPDPQISTSQVPDVEGTVRTYLDAWSAGDFAAMYSMLTTLSRDAISQEEFETRYSDVAQQVNLFQVTYNILQTLTTPQTAQVAYQISLHSAIVGPITRDTTMDLSLENGDWKIAWDDRLILPELAGGNTLSMERFVPARGDIYDNDGDPLATTTTATALTVIPSLVTDEASAGLVTTLSRLTGRSIADLEAAIFPEDGEPDYFVGAGEITRNAFDQSFIGEYGAMMAFNDYDTRFYFDQGAAAHAIGYVGSIPAEEVDSYVPLGYQSDDRIGRLGIEAWGEEYLSGTRGGTLYVLNPNGEIVTQLASVAPQAAASIYATLDRDLQFQAQQAIKDFTGAIVVLERDTGRVLAMVSSPDFEPNWADFENANSLWNNYFPDNQLRFYNRATLGQYPPGSIFKVVTMSAALESGIFAAGNTFNCAHEWNGLAGITLYDWTLEKELPPSGTLDLQQGLMRSCNPWFYQIGLTLYSQEFESLVADTARGFGLGSPTGIQAVEESRGQVEDPNLEQTIGASEAVQQAIGQGTTTITPLQAAVYAAAIGNGGTLYRPYLVDRVESFDGQALLSFEPQANGTLPVSQENLEIVQAAMRMVVNDPRGTAYNRFLNFSIPVYGKTGTASVVGQDPHAWFIGYTDAQREGQPDIAIAVLVENIGDGSEFAAPIFRRVANYYFFGTAGPLYPWESGFGILDPVYFDPTLQEEDATPTPEGNLLLVDPSS